jgi:membrane protein DedA with SNARE-associated domain
LIPGTIFIGYKLGEYFDKKYNTENLIIFILAALVLSFVLLVYKVNNYRKKLDQLKKEKDIEQ